MQGIAQKILAEPGKYSVQQLTQAVQDGVLPAYIGVPLIQDKVQRQKQSQMSQQMQQGPQSQPPIAEQVMAEARGLEQLPTNLPQNYAGGGIVAFADNRNQPVDSNMPDTYETPYDRMNRLNREREAREAAYVATPEGRAAQLRQDRAGFLAPIAAAADIPSGFYNGVAGLTQMGANAIGVPRIGRALGIYSPDVTSVEVPKIGTGSATPYFDQLRQYAAGKSDTPAATNVAATDTTKPAADTTTQAAPTDRAAPGKGGISDLLSGLGIGGESALGRAPGVGLKQPNIDLVGQTKTFLDDFNARDEARTKENEKRIQEAQGKVTGKAYEGLETSLRKEAEEFGADKAQAKNMALFKAGLAMMAGTSRHALENIGKGAMVGAEDYQTAAKDIKKAQKENERAMAMVEQARRAESIGDRDKAIDRMDRANEHASKRDQFGTTALMNATGKSAELSTEMWKTLTSTQAHLAAADISGKYHLAGNILGAMGKDRMTPYQEKRLQIDFEKNNPIADTRAMYAKQLGLSKVPAPGVDKTFDTNVNTMHQQKMYEFMYGSPAASGAGAGGAGANPYAGYKIVP